MLMKKSTLGIIIGVFILGSIVAGPISISGAQVTVKIAHFYDPMVETLKPGYDWIQNVMDAVEKKHPEIQFKHEIYKWDELDPKMIMDKKAGVAHDVCFVSPQIWLKHKKADVFINLKPYLETLPEERIEDISWNPSWRYKQTYPEGIPLNLHVGFFAWRKDVFRKMGLDPERPPKNSEELIQVAEKLTRNDRYGLGIFTGPDPQNFQLCLVPFTYGFGVKEIFDEKGRAVFANDEKAVEAVKYVRDLFLKYKVASKEVAFLPSHTDYSELFRAKDPVYAIDTGFFSALLKSVEDAGLTKGVWPATTNPQLTDVGYSLWPLPTHTNFGHGGWNLAIHSLSKHPDEAWTFIEYATRPEVLKDLYDIGLPPYKSMWGKPEYQTDLYQTFFKQAAEYSRPFPTGDYYYELADFTQKMWADIILKEAPVEETMKKYQRQYNQKYYGQG